MTINTFQIMTKKKKETKQLELLKTLVELRRRKTNNNSERVNTKTRAQLSDLTELKTTFSASEISEVNENLCRIQTLDDVSQTLPNSQTNDNIKISDVLRTNVTSLTSSNLTNLEFQEDEKQGKSGYCCNRVSAAEGLPEKTQHPPNVNTTNNKGMHQKKRKKKANKLKETMMDEHRSQNYLDCVNVKDDSELPYGLNTSTVNKIIEEERGKPTKRKNSSEDSSLNGIDEFPNPIISSVRVIDADKRPLSDTVFVNDNPENQKRKKKNKKNKSSQQQASTENANDKSDCQSLDKSGKDFSTVDEPVDENNTENETNVNCKILHLTTSNPIQSDSENENGKNQLFTFTISQSSWQNIKPEIKVYGGRGKVSRRLKGKWTDVFFEKVNKIHKGCILSFKTHSVKKIGSRKTSAPFLNATAVCTGTFCNSKFRFSIREEPSDYEEVCVCCSITGSVKHKKDEINRRNITGNKRIKTAEEVAKAGSVNTYYNLLLDSNTDQLDQGNFTTVPNPNVIRKIVSEQIKREYLHVNIMSELQLLKDAYDLEKDTFIRETGLDPFTIILFSDKQIEILKQNGPHVSLHLDATGSAVMNIPGQKRLLPVFFSYATKSRNPCSIYCGHDYLPPQHSPY